MPNNKLIPRLLSHVSWLARRGGRFTFTALRFPGVIQIACFAILYRYASKKWCDKYCGVWEPAFPMAWTVFVLVLAVIPVFALVQLVWLLSATLLSYVIKSRRNKKRHGPTESLVFDAEEAERMLQDSDGDGNTRSESPPPPRSRLALSVSRVFWWAQILLYSWLLLWGIWEYRHYENDDDVRFRPALQQALSHKTRDPSGYAKGERIYFAAAFYNNQDVLPYWTRSLLDVIAYLGPNNVYVSVVENNSGDSTPDLLRRRRPKAGRHVVE
ncbi:hypothetical protein NM688_g6861 [Phlebia brevispora]|uniref:Uncharacterized protein n=1 Tax=Phlebia brevispora TaxID=194682 RepID=A0ACC1SC13_9APHY|nr:hypothetical protein NM688_g6861 [Phlebia brevispora]